MLFLAEGWLWSTPWWFTTVIYIFLYLFIQKYLQGVQPNTRRVSLQNNIIISFIISFVIDNNDTNNLQNIFINKIRIPIFLSLLLEHYLLLDRATAFEFNT